MVRRHDLCSMALDEAEVATPIVTLNVRYGLKAGSFHDVIWLPLRWRGLASRSERFVYRSRSRKERWDEPGRARPPHGRDGHPQRRTGAVAERRCLEQREDVRVAILHWRHSSPLVGGGAEQNSVPLIFESGAPKALKQTREEAMGKQRFGQESSQRGGRSGAAGSRTSGSSSARNQEGGVATTVTSQVQDALDQQVVRGARTITNVARSARRAADELETDAPQIAGLVRGVADRVEEYSRSLETQSVTDIYQSASDFTRRQPAVVFGVAALAGFFALRTFRSSSTSSERGRPVSSPRGEEFHGS